MSKKTPDSLFKLRLSSELRSTLEQEAAKRGLTLTAEILRRIEETNSSLADKVAELEKVVYDGTRGNAALGDRVIDLDSYLSSLREDIDNLQYNLGFIIKQLRMEF